MSNTNLIHIECKRVARCFLRFSRLHKAIRLSADIKMQGFNEAKNRIKGRFQNTSFLSVRRHSTSLLSPASLFLRVENLMPLLEKSAN